MRDGKEPKLGLRSLSDPFPEHSAVADGDLGLNHLVSRAPRIPFGIAVDLSGAPIEFFFELAVRFILITDHDHDHDRADLTGALGFRIYF